MCVRHGVAAVKREGHRIGCVCADGQRRRMVRHQKYGKGFAASAQGGQDAPKDFTVDQLDRSDFIFRFAAMPAFVGGLHMDINKVVTVLQQLQRGLPLAGEVCVDIAGRARYIDTVKPCADRNSLDQIDG